jgi:beta-phosphoglucomutase-like phosphatase (HAD superfamily)
MPSPFDRRLKAVLFDLDGTIGNTLPLCFIRQSSRCQRLDRFCPRNRRKD